MAELVWLGVTWVDPLRVPATVEPWHPLEDPWSADDSAAASDAVAERNGAVAARLAEVLPGLEVQDPRDLLEDCLDQDLPAETIVRRLHRSRNLSAPWRGGRLHLQLFDAVIQAEIPVVDLPRRDHPAFVRAVQDLIDLVAASAGMVPWDPASNAPFPPGQAALRMMEARRPMLARHARAVRRERIYRALGVPSLLLSGLLAFAAAGLIVQDAVNQGTLAAHADPARATRFVTDSVPPPGRRWGLIPSFALEGHVPATGERMRLPVTREEYLRAGPAAPYTVVPTAAPATPYVLRSAVEATQPVARVGDIGIAWHALLGLIPVGFWGWYIAGPLAAARPERRGVVLAAVTRRLVGLLTVAAVLVAVGMVMRFV